MDTKKDRGVALNMLSRKQDQLLSVISSEIPTNPALHEAHVRRVTNAKLYLEELQQVLGMLEDDASGIRINLVPRPTFDNAVATAGFATEEFDGFYCRVYNVSNYMYGSTLLIYTAPLATL